MGMSVLWMPTRLTCFYCGAKSKRKHVGKVQSFQCEGCEATNYLDENGAITDPPMSVTRADLTPERPHTSHSPPSISPDPPPDLVFCDVCLRNQRLHYENLRLYLPERHDPRYLEFAAALPKYKERLEQQYPLICSDCAPRARERIKDAGYLAKTDHIRRLMDATRSGAIPPRRHSTWRWLLISAGGLLWWTAVITQILWHVLGILSEPYDAALTPDDEPSHLSSCVYELREHGQASMVCVTKSATYLPLVAVAAISSLWYNPQLYKRYFGRQRGKLLRLTEYYCHCVVSLSARLVIASLLASPSTSPVQGDLYRAAHGFSVIFTLGTTLAALSIVKLDTTARVNFHLDPSKILPDVPERPNDVPRPLRTGGMYIDDPPSPSPQKQKAATPLQPVNINKQTPSKPLFSRPSLLDSENDPDAMDWSPITTTPSHNLRPRYTAPPAEHSPLISGPNPFAQKVPNAPPTRMRHPLERHAVSQAAPGFTEPQLEKHNFFSSLRQTASPTRPLRQASQETEAATDDEAPNPFKPARGPGSQKIDFNPAPPRLALQKDREETGLESLFNTVFFIQEEPAEVAQMQTRQPQTQTQTQFASRPWTSTRQNPLQSSSLRNAQQQQHQQPKAGLRMFEVHRDEPPVEKWKAALWSVLVFGVLPACILGCVFLGVRYARAHSCVANFRL